MQYQDFLNKVIDEGKDAAISDYTEPRHKTKLEGSIAGFESCRHKTPDQLAEDLKAAEARTTEARRASLNAPEFWRLRAFELEIEWVCNAVSVWLIQNGKQPIASHLPTVRGMLKAQEIVDTHILEAQYIG